MSIVTLYRNPAFWTGAAKTAETFGDIARAGEYHRLVDALNKGEPLNKIPEFARWTQRSVQWSNQPRT